MVSPYLIGPAPLPSTEISNTPRLSSMPEVSRDTLSVADTVPLPSGRVSHVFGLDTSTGRGRTPRRPTGLRTWPCIGKIPVEVRLAKQRRWLAVETLCVWMWMPSRAVGIVQSRSDRFGSGPVCMPACDRLLHRHAFVRDRP